MSTPLIQTLAGPDPMAKPDPRLAHLADRWAVALTTYKRNGTPVTRPVNIVVEGDRAFFRTYDKAWKVRRLRNDPRVEIAPSTWRGRPTGPALRARARLLEGAEAERAGRLVDRKHPFFQRVFVRLGHRVQRYRTLHYEVRLKGDVLPDRVFV
jgi:PPOX class probable F420-dependent enzyme